MTHEEEEDLKEQKRIRRNEQQRLRREMKREAAEQKFQKTVVAPLLKAVQKLPPITSGPLFIPEEIDCLRQDVEVDVEDHLAAFTHPQP